MAQTADRWPRLVTPPLGRQSGVIGPAQRASSAVCSRRHQPGIGRPARRRHQIGRTPLQAPPPPRHQISRRRSDTGTVGCSSGGCDARCRWPAQNWRCDAFTAFIHIFSLTSRLCFVSIRAQSRLVSASYPLFIQSLLFPPPTHGRTLLFPVTPGQTTLQRTRAVVTPGRIPDRFASLPSLPAVPRQTCQPHRGGPAGRVIVSTPPTMARTGRAGAAAPLARAGGALSGARSVSADYRWRLRALVTLSQPAGRELDAPVGWLSQQG